MRTEKQPTRRSRGIVWAVLFVLLLLAVFFQAVSIHAFRRRQDAPQRSGAVSEFSLPPIRLSVFPAQLTAERSTDLRCSGYYRSHGETLLVLDVTDVYVLTNRAADAVTTWVSSGEWSGDAWGPMLLRVGDAPSCAMETDAAGRETYGRQLTLQPGESARIERTWRAKTARELLLSCSLDAPPCTSHTLCMEIPDWLEITDQNLGLTRKTGSVTLPLPTVFEPDAPELSFQFRILPDAKTTALLEKAPPAVP